MAVARPPTLGINEIMPVAIYIQSRGVLCFEEEVHIISKLAICLGFVKSAMVTIKYDLSY